MESIATPSDETRVASTPSPRRFIAPAVLCVIILATMGRLLLCDFTWWDDPHTLHDNPFMREVQFNTFTHYWAHADFDIYMPLTDTIWALVAIAAKVSPNATGITLNPMMFHALNLFTHIAGAWAAFQLFRRLFKCEWAAVIGALVWALHPIQVESVGWLSGYKDVLSGTMVLFSLERFVAWRQQPNKTWPLAWPVFLLLAILAKPSAMTAPLLLAVIDLLLLHTPVKKSLQALWIAGVIVLPFMIVAKVVQPAASVYSPLWARPLIALDSLAFYIGKTFVPISLGIDYGRSPEAIIHSRAIAYTWLLPAAIAMLLIWFWRSRRYSSGDGRYVVLAAALILALAPIHVLGLTRFDFQQYSTVTDHYAYVALIGPALLVAWLVARFGKWAFAMASAAVAVMAVLTASLCHAWTDEGTLMQQALSVNPRSYIGYNNLAGYYARIGRPDAELWAMQQAEAIAPQSALIQRNIASHYFVANDLVTGDYYFQRAVTLALSSNDRPEVIVNLLTTPIDVYIDLHRIDDAERYLNIGLAHFPKDEALLKRRDKLRAIRNDPNFAKLPSVLPATQPATAS